MRSFLQGSKNPRSLDLGSVNGYIGGGTNPLSRMSIGGLQDLGYAVDYTKADAFSTTTLNSLSLDKQLNIAAMEQVIKPRFQVR